MNNLSQLVEFVGTVRLFPKRDWAVAANADGLEKRGELFLLVECRGRHEHCAALKRRLFQFPDEGGNRPGAFALVFDALALVDDKQNSFVDHGCPGFVGKTIMKTILFDRFSLLKKENMVKNKKR